MELSSGKDFREDGPVSLVPQAGRGDIFESESHMEGDRIVVRAIVLGVNRPVGDSHR